MKCGLDQTSEVLTRAKNKTRKSRSLSPIEHINPITGSSCDGKHISLHLAHEFQSDFLKLRFTDEAKPHPLVGKISNFEAGNKVGSRIPGFQDEALAIA